MARSRRHWFVVAGLLALGHQSAAHAFWPHHRRPAEQPPAVAPPAYPPPAVDPANPNPPVLPPDIGVPPGAAPADLGGNDFLGGQAAGTFVPNMFGDFFAGAGRTRSTLIGAGPANLAGQFVFGPAPPVTSGTHTSTFNPNAAGAMVNIFLNGFGNKSVGTNGQSYIGSFYQVNDGPLTSHAVNGNTTNIFSQVIDRVRNSQEGRLALLSALNGASSRDAKYFYARLDNLSLGPVGSVDAQGNLVYDYSLTAGALQGVAFDRGIAVQNPTDGGNVGRTKVSDDTSPLPRDRVFLNYDYYSGVRLTADGMNVTRMSAGAEMTFLDRQASLEVRVPFASTLDSTILLDGATGRTTELGNIALSAKYLWTRDPVLNFSSGITFALPTAKDTVLGLSDGTDLVRVENQAVLLTPFAAVTYTPTDRLFSQSWVSLGIDVMGNDAKYLNFLTGGTDTQKIYALPVLSADTQIGYWVVRDTAEDALIRGLAPFIELHYNAGLDIGRVSAKYDGVTVVEARTGYDDFNLTVGFTTHLRNNLFVSNALVVPLGEKNSRFFDWQYGLRMNMLYGPSARASDEAMAALRARAGQTGAGSPVVPPPASIVPTAADDVVTPAQYAEAAPPSPMQETLACAACQPPEVPPFFGDFVGVAGVSGGVRVPIIPAGAGLKVTDNDGPRPADRVYYTHNTFNGAFERQNPAGFRDFGVTRNTIGVESTFFDGYGSFGARLPFVQLNGNGFDDSVVGDLTLVAKLAWAQDEETGSLLSSGVNLTFGTGSPSDAATLLDGTAAPRAIWIQPWTGFVFNHDRLYTQGVVSLAAPSEDAYPVELFTSVAAGFWLVKSDTSDIRGLIPTVELHVNTPITNRGGGRRVVAVDEANVTTGLNVLLPRMTVGGAVSVPAFGQGSYRTEFFGTVNFRF